MVAILGANSVSGGYEVSNSLRFNDDDSAHLDNTFSTTTNRKTYSYSTWIKRSVLDGANQHIFGVYIDGSNHSLFRFDSGEKLDIRNNLNNSIFQLDSDMVFRDTSAWYHILIVTDTTESTDSNRIKVYVNGTQITLSGSYPTLNKDTYINDNRLHTIAEVSSGSEEFDGYMAETHFIDGSAKQPTDFGEFDDNGVWVPIKYTGSYGTNGFYLEFKQTGTSQNSSGIGADTSGNDNHFAVTNLAATDITEDTCTNNFCTLNPLARYPYNGTLSEGNVKFTGTNGGNEYYSTSTFAFTQGKWYSEFKLTSDTDGMNIGIMKTDLFNSTSPHSTSSAYTFTRGTKRHDGASTSYGSTPSTNDILMMAVDMDNGKIWWGLNGTYFNSGNPASGSNEAFSSISGEFYVLVNDDYSSRVPVCLCNFGNPPFAISSGNTDGKYGNFEYAPPSGYYALCTKRLAEFG